MAKGEAHLAVKKAESQMNLELGMYCSVSAGDVMIEEMWEVVKRVWQEGERFILEHKLQYINVARWSPSQIFYQLPLEL